MEEPITPSGLRKAAAAALVLVLLAAASAPAANPRSYSALGDSYTAVPFVPSPTGDTLRCQRSTNSYPAIVARSLQIGTYRDASCSGAVVNNMTTPPNSIGGLPSNEVAQFSALRDGVELVTLGIGYNDIGLGPLFNRCFSTGLLSPTGAECASFAPGGSDSMQRAVESVAPSIASALEGSMSARRSHGSSSLATRASCPTTARTAGRSWPSAPTTWPTSTG